MGTADIEIEIPGFADLDISTVCTDYTGTLSLKGELIHGVKQRLRRLAKKVDIYVITSDTRGTVRKQLEKVLPLKGLDGNDPDGKKSDAKEYLTLIKPAGSEAHDIQKKKYLRQIVEQRGIGLQNVAVFGNGRNDRLWLQEVKNRHGLAIAVDVGEGCAIEAMNNAHIFISGICNALDLLLDMVRLKSTLRTK